MGYCNERINALRLYTETCLIRPPRWDHLSYRPLFRNLSSFILYQKKLSSKRGLSRQVVLTLCCIKHQICIPPKHIWCKNVPTLWTHMTLKCTKVDSSHMIPRTLWQIGVDQIQTPLQIPHLMGNLERWMDLLYTYLSQSSWSYGWWINLGTFWCYMHSEGRCILTSYAFRK